MAENKKQKLLPRHRFIQHLARNFIIGSILIALALLIGMLGYSYFEKMDWVDAYLNASMILSGMGPAEPLKTEGGKLFAGTYALFSGIMFLVTMAIVFAPIFHRFFHQLNITESDKD